MVRNFVPFVPRMSLWSTFVVATLWSILFTFCINLCFFGTGKKEIKNRYSSLFDFKNYLVIFAELFDIQNSAHYQHAGNSMYWFLLLCQTKPYAASCGWYFCNSTPIIFDHNTLISKDLTLSHSSLHMYYFRLQISQSLYGFY